MPERIPQSVTIRVPLQAYLTDHTSAATGKTLAVQISKNGAGYGNPSGGATNTVEIGSGSYYVDLTTTDTGTLGPLFVKGSVSGVDDAIAIYNVVSATNGGLSNLDAAISTVSTLTQANVRTAVGLASANLDTQIATLATPTNITAGIITTVTNLTNAPTNGDLTAAMKTSVTAAVPTANANADALLDRAAGIETGITPRQGWRVMLAAMAGKASGLATTSVIYRDTNDTKNRISATVDASGNRSAVTLDAS